MKVAANETFSLIQLPVAQDQPLLKEPLSAGSRSSEKEISASIIVVTEVLILKSTMRFSENWLKLIPG